PWAWVWVWAVMGSIVPAASPVAARVKNFRRETLSSIVLCLLIGPDLVCLVWLIHYSSHGPVPPAVQVPKTASSPVTEPGTVHNRRCTAQGRDASRPQEALRGT